ncbi:hypothetical protein Pyn_16177 [Prunus yedoensis var. nudiflora]|uniref:Uncharacterized protein n=1 Tax=Prunus yedoensis var. nudiflora TaxID=2094558 RepID=A0A314Y222_PRUYE|nr:hypothetical protein Pyn_16177 [Prunus yedoensis var. nudiflora]
MVQRVCSGSLVIRGAKGASFVQCRVARGVKKGLGSLLVLARREETRKHVRMWHSANQGHVRSTGQHQTTWKLSGHRNLVNLIGRDE